MEAAYHRIAFSSDLTQAVAKADLVIEAIPDVAAIKTDFYKKLGKVAPEKTIFATNSSTLLPSQFAEVSGRPAKFLALHFANTIGINNTAEVMGHAARIPRYSVRSRPLRGPSAWWCFRCIRNGRGIF